MRVGGQTMLREVSYVSADKAPLYVCTWWRGGEGGQYALIFCCFSPEVLPLVFISVCKKQEGGQGR